MTRSAPAHLPAGVGALSSAELAPDRVLPVIPELSSLLPSRGLVRGSTISCDGEAAVSLALALAVGPSRAGSWVGIVGLPDLGVVAAGEAGVVLHRLVAVTAGPATFDDATWAHVLATMVDGFDVVVLGPPARRVRMATARRIQARAQARGTVLVTITALDAFGSDVWLRTGCWAWDGLGEGHGRLARRRLTVDVGGRRVPRPQRGELWLPSADGAPGLLAATDPSATVPPTPTPTPTPGSLRRTG